MITLKQLTKTYDTAAGEFPALCGIDLEIPSGQLVAIVGRSGSGKSTLLNIIAGIDRPSSGTVTVDGKSLAGLRESELTSWRAKNIGLVFQFFQLMPTLTAVENVMLPMDFAGSVAPQDRRARALELLDRFGMKRHADKLPSALSGGEQQRVAIARSIANDPPVLLADEPTGNLDSHTAESIFTAFASLVELGKTVLIVTHERAISVTIQSVIELADGQVVGSQIARQSA